jgi:hypothetical protein
MEKVTFIPYEKAKQIVANIIEMEDPTRDGKRIFNVYNHRGQAICWFDADQVEEEIEAKEFDDIKEHILHFIPDWAV